MLTGSAAYLTVPSLYNLPPNAVKMRELEPNVGVSWLEPHRRIAIAPALPDPNLLNTPISSVPKSIEMAAERLDHSTHAVDTSAEARPHCGCPLVAHRDAILDLIVERTAAALTHRERTSS